VEADRKYRQSDEKGTVSFTDRNLVELVDFEGGAKKERDVILPSEYKTGILFNPVL
jgi:hypothetical protein